MQLAEVSRHFGTSAEVSVGHFGTGDDVSVTFSKWCLPNSLKPDLPKLDSPNPDSLNLEKVRKFIVLWKKSYSVSSIKFLV